MVAVRPHPAILIVGGSGELVRQRGHGEADVVVHARIDQMPQLFLARPGIRPGLPDGRLLVCKHPQIYVFKGERLFQGLREVLKHVPFLHERM